MLNRTHGPLSKHEESWESPVRNLILVFGDQLDHRSAVFEGFDNDTDVAWMAEVAEQATHVWCHKLRIALFLSAMRHFRDELIAKGRSVHYHQLTLRPSDDRGRSFSEVLRQDIRRLRPAKVITVRPGDYRVLDEVRRTMSELDVELEIKPDSHFYCSTDEFRKYAAGKKKLVFEYFYRWQRRTHDILLDENREPIGGRWNFDRENRDSFDRAGPGAIPKPKRFRPDQVSMEVLHLVENRFADHPGSLEHFTLPVTRRQARTMLRAFIKQTLPDFGRFEDAMWTDEPFLYHSRLSAPLNLKMLNPRECVDAAVVAFQKGEAPLNSVEGFIRQIIGWREFVRGIYWLKMPQYVELNHFAHKQDLPSFYWDGQTEMQCVRQSMQHVIDHGYSHHIHRLMVLGNLAQLLGVHPQKFHEWHMAMYVDAVDWVSLPNTLGMSQFADGGIVGTKPYCASGNYIHKMSNFCAHCRYDQKRRYGEDACPLTTLYWDFLDRNYEKLRANARMNFQLKNAECLRSNSAELKMIQEQAEKLRIKWSQ